jgi:hypothetical protein
MERFGSGLCAAGVGGRSYRPAPRPRRLNCDEAVMVMRLFTLGFDPTAWREEIKMVTNS